MPMGRASMTRKSPRDGEEDEACVDSMKLLPDLVKEAVDSGRGLWYPAD